MIFFSSKPKSTSSTPAKSGQQTTPSKCLFTRRGGRPFSQRELSQRMMYARLRPAEKEYVKTVMAKHDTPYSRGVTKEEFHKCLDEMKKNTRDKITDTEIQRIKDVFK